MHAGGPKTREGTPVTDIVSNDRVEHPHAALIDGLRQLADFYEQHPEVPAPPMPDFQHCVLATEDATGIAEIEQVAAVLGSPVRYGRHVTTELQMAGLRVRAYYCTRKSVHEHDARTSYADAIDVSAVTSC